MVEIKSSWVFTGAIAVLIVALALTLEMNRAEKFQMEQAELKEAKFVAESIRNTALEDTTCYEITLKLAGLGTEDFEGVELIKDAWNEKREGLNCK